MRHTRSHKGVDGTSSQWQTRAGNRDCAKCGRRSVSVHCMVCHKRAVADVEMTRAGKRWYREWAARLKAAEQTAGISRGSYYSDRR